MGRTFIAVFTTCIICILLVTGCILKREYKLIHETESQKEKEIVTIRTNIPVGELSADQIKEFHSENINIHIEQISADNTELMALVAAGNAPDVIRIIGAQELPFFVTRNMALNLDKYFDSSTLIKKDDLLPISNIYRWDGEKQGSGHFYGLPKDFSPDMGIFINKKLFADAKIPIPDAKTPLTYKQIFEYAEKLTRKDASGNTDIWGFVPGSTYDSVMATALLQLQGKTLYSDDFQIPLFSSEENKKIMQWAVELAKSGATQSPLNQLQDWTGGLFLQDKIAMMQCGYWFSSMISQNKSVDELNNYMYLPAPQWTAGNKRYSPTTSATGAIIFKKTKNSKEAFRFFEWYMAGKPSDDRAKSGWGLPIWKSKLNEIPQNNDFDKQCYNVVQDEMKYMGDFLKFNPYLNSADINMIIERVVAPVYFGKVTVDNAAVELDKEIKILIDESKKGTSFN